MPEPQQSPSRFYRPELDVLRFFAFACVYVVHLRSGTQFFGRFASQVKSTCEVGLPLFFFLSSFLITELLGRERDRTGSVDLRRFYVRRILRIWPLYLLMVCGVYLLWHASGQFEPISRGRFLAYLLMAGNWYAVWTRDIGFSPIDPLWSISVEEQFYVLWPFLYRRGGRGVATVVSLLTLPVALAAIAFVAREPGAQDVPLWCNSFVLFVYFGGGALVAIYLDKLPRPKAAWSRVLVFAASLAVCWLGAGHYVESSVSFGPAVVRYLSFLVAAVGMLLAVYGAESAGRARVLVYLGKISYGLYVFHMLAQQAAERLTEVWLRHFRHGQGEFTPLMSIALTVAMAVLSYRFLESPFLRLKHRFEVVKTREV